MNPDDLIPVAINFILVLFFLLAPLMLARKWMPGATRLAEKLAIPVLGGVTLLSLLSAVAPYLLSLAVLLLVICIPLGLYAVIRQHNRRRRSAVARSRHGRQAGRHQVVRRPPGRRPQQRQRN